MLARRAAYLCREGRRKTGEKINRAGSPAALQSEYRQPVVRERERESAW